VYKIRKQTSSTSFYAVKVIDVQNYFSEAFGGESQIDIYCPQIIVNKLNIMQDENLLQEQDLYLFE